jgi:TadE-like protein
MMTEMELPNPRPIRRRHRTQRGQEVIEFILVMIPLFLMLFVYLDIAWGIFVKATLEQAVRIGCRYGITNTVPDPNNSDPTLSACPDLTTCVKEHVQWAAGSTPGKDAGGVGLLGGGTGYALIQVHYYQSNGTLTLTDVSNGASGTPNAAQNLMVVSINNFPLHMLVPMQPIYWDPNSPSQTAMVTVASADTISGVLTPPPPGQAP